MDVKLPLMEVSSIKSHIYTVGDTQIMLDEDLAKLYQVETRVFNQAVKRNLNRFPTSFRFQLTDEEFKNLRSQFVTSSEHGGRRYLPYAFTEQGVTMLSAVLRSDVAVQISIQIMQAFVDMRHFMQNNASLIEQINNLEVQQQATSRRVDILFDAMSEHKLPAKQGIFYDGQVFDAYQLINQIFESATKRIVIIDNYLDDSVITMLQAKNKDVAVVLLTNHVSKKLKLSVDKFNSQYGGVTLQQFSAAHDRFIIVDNQDIYHIGASLKDAGKKWFAFSKLEASALVMLEKAGVK